MGLDFLRRMAPSYHRLLDQRAIDLHTPQMLASTLPPAGRTATAVLRDGCSLAAGTQVIVRSVDGHLVVQRDTTVAAVFDAPPPAFVSRVGQGGGIEIGEVRLVRPLSGEVEISLCD